MTTRTVPSPFSFCRIRVWTLRLPRVCPTLRPNLARQFCSLFPVTPNRAQCTGFGGEYVVSGTAP